MTQQNGPRFDIADARQHTLGVADAKCRAFGTFSACVRFLDQHHGTLGVMGRPPWPYHRPSATSREAEAITRMLGLGLGICEDE